MQYAVREQQQQQQQQQLLPPDLCPGVLAFLATTPLAAAAASQETDRVVRIVTELQGHADTDAAWRARADTFGHASTRWRLLSKCREWLDSPAAVFDNVVLCVTLVVWWVALEPRGPLELAAHAHLLPALLRRCSLCTGAWADGMVAASRACSILNRIVGDSAIALHWVPPRSDCLAPAASPAAALSATFGVSAADIGGGGGGGADGVWSPAEPFAGLNRIIRRRRGRGSGDDAAVVAAADGSDDEWWEPIEFHCSGDCSGNSSDSDDDFPPWDLLAQSEEQQQPHDRSGNSSSSSSNTVGSSSGGGGGGGSTALSLSPLPLACFAARTLSLYADASHSSDELITGN